MQITNKGIKALLIWEIFNYWQYCICNVQWFRFGNQ